MKIKFSKGIRHLKDQSVIIDREIILVDGKPLMINGIPQLSGGHELTIVDVISNILTNRKVNQVNTLKAYALA